MADARKILERRDILEDGTIVEIVLYKIDDPEQYPSEFKYSFQLWDPRTGQTLLRYDNSHKYEGHSTRHHQHVRGQVKPLSYPGSISKLLENFLRRL